MNKLIVLLLLCGFINGVYAKDSTEITQEEFITKILNQQVKQQISLKRSVSSILTLYPEQVELVLTIALDKFPDQYADIIMGAIKAEPVLACEVIEIALNANVATTADIISIAIRAEPAYAQEIVNAAVLNNPADVENIVRIAIQTEPVVSDAVVSNTMRSFPESVMNILTGAIKALPEQVASFVLNAINLDPQSSEEMVTKAVNSTDAKHDALIVETAIKAGLNQESAVNAAVAGGAQRKTLAKVD